MNKIKSLLGAALLLCITILITPKAQAAPPCFLFTITGGQSLADVMLDGVNIKGVTTTFIEGDVVTASAGGCPPVNEVVATLTVYRWDIQSNSYLRVGTETIWLSTSCESGSWTLHVHFQSQQPPCGTASTSYTVNQLYCPCGS